MKQLDALLNSVTMYRLLVYGLGGVALGSILFAAFGLVALDPLDMVISILLLGASVFTAEYIFSKIWRRPMNMESWVITTLILFFIIDPAHSVLSAVILLLAGVIASASKFILAWKGKHIFNPAAYAAAVLSLTAIWPVTWWVGSTALAWLTIPLGIAVIRKLHHETFALVFVGVALLVQAVQFMGAGQLSLDTFVHAVIASPFIFLVSIMLTEPATMPSRYRDQLIFSALVAFLYTTAWEVGPLYIYPAVALLIGNLYAFVVSPKVFVALRLRRVEPMASNISHYVFEPETPFTYKAGQYMEWTLPNVALDGRGNRRMFTLASSPTENEVHLGVKFYEPSSAYKLRLRQLEENDVMYVSQLTGRFTLPKNQNRKLAFIAGGIGVTPFRSMIRYILDSHEPRDVVLIYSVASEQEFAYRDLLNEAQQHGIAVHLVVTTARERLDAELISRLIPDYSQRLFYISGSSGMVDAVKKHLKSLGLSRLTIKTDHFSGY